MSVTVDYDERADVLYIFLEGRKARFCRETEGDLELVLGFDSPTDMVGIFLLGARLVSAELWASHPWRYVEQEAIPVAIDEAVAAWMRATPRASTG